MDALDVEVKELVERDVERATEHLLRAVGPEIYSILLRLAPAPDVADDAFSAFSERIWRALPAFRFGEGSLRGWCYIVARNELRRGLGKRQRERAKRTALPRGLEEIAEQTRASTAAYRRTEVKNEVRALRECLTDEQQLVLTLRVDRNLSWRDVAAFMADEGEDLARVSARVRKQFQRAKERLRAEAEARGLLGGS